MGKETKSHPSSNSFTADTRFSHIHTDPRFARIARKDVKVQIDDRFRSVFNDTEFVDQPSVDRYGRKLKKGEVKRSIQKFYHLEDEEGDSGHDEVYDPSRGIGVIGSSSEEEFSEEEIETDLDDLLSADDKGYEEEDVPRGDDTSRLAVVNLDWDNIRSVDLLVVFNSFITPSLNGTQGIKKVSIYPSDFGKVRMEEEGIHGPTIFKTSNGTNGQKHSEHATNNQTEKKKGSVNGNAEGTVEEEEEKIDPKKLRNYQLERLRYFYAIVDCTNVTTASALYKSLDGAEHEASANHYDLRFVPDHIVFDDTPRDEAVTIPDNYTPTEFVTEALQHSKPKLTWDETDISRTRLLHSAFSKDAREDADYSKLLASSSEEEEDERENKQEKYRSLLLAGLGNVNEGDEDDTQSGLQATFKSSVTQDTTNDIEPEPEMTTMDRYLRREQERKKKRKKEKSQEKEQDSRDLGFDDPFFMEDDGKNGKMLGKETKSANKWRETEQKEQEREALELLMQDDTTNMDGRHFNLADIRKAEKASKKKTKGKKGKFDDERENELQEDFEIDVNDRRFQALFEGQEFAMDPTHSGFKKTKGMEKLLEEGRRRRRQEIKEIDGGQRNKKKRRI